MAVVLSGKVGKKRTGGGRQRVCKLRRIQHTHIYTHSKH